ncbi:hypothetical protein AW736_26455 [Termitidicoccus mucosus]|uniref:Uncharacterized protein n=3 Tax=Termitidicoccus mucosus TaxID=1184151 RepID=A0A178IR61_9BACT|nr:hypothetical protein AW736_26455 [Opitutaceae bacterium TSB47]
MSVFGRVKRLIFKPYFGVLVLVVLFGIIGYRLYNGSTERRRSTSAPAEKAAEAKHRQEEAPNQPVVAKFGASVSKFIAPPEEPRKSNQDEGPPPIPENVKKQLVTEPTPIALYPYRPAPKKERTLQPATYYLPPYRLIRCMLISSPETGNPETPIIAITLEDTVNIDKDGATRVVIPAGVELHGMGNPNPARDSITASGRWTFVWRTNSEQNSMTLSVAGTALTRDYDETRGIWGPDEKKAGIKGHRFQSISESAVKLVLLDAIAAMTRKLKDYNPVINPLTNQTVNQEVPGVKNAALEGVAGGVDRISKLLDDMRKQIDEKGYYVAVLPGKEFYLYTLEPIDLRRSTLPPEEYKSGKEEPAQKSEPQNQSAA